MKRPTSPWISMQDALAEAMRYFGLDLNEPIRSTGPAAELRTFLQDACGDGLIQTRGCVPLSAVPVSIEAAGWRIFNPAWAAGELAANWIPDRVVQHGGVSIELHMTIPSNYVSHPGFSRVQLSSGEFRKWLATGQGDDAVVVPIRGAVVPPPTNDASIACVSHASALEPYPDNPPAELLNQKYRADDWPLLVEMRRGIADGRYKSAREAAGKVGLSPRGSGYIDSRTDRLRKAYAMVKWELWELGGAASQTSPT